MLNADGIDSCKQAGNVSHEAGSGSNSKRAPSKLTEHSVLMEMRKRHAHRVALQQNLDHVKLMSTADIKFMFASLSMTECDEVYTSTVEGASSQCNTKPCGGRSCAWGG